MAKSFAPGNLGFEEGRIPEIRERLNKSGGEPSSGDPGLCGSAQNGPRLGTQEEASYGVRPD